MAYDDKPNVIHFTEHGIPRANFGELADLTQASLGVLLKSIEFYGFESEAGPLENCSEWIELRKRLK
jgi:hypothetical protein